MKANIKLSLYRKTAVAILALLRNVIAKMTGNAFFPAPPVPLADAKTKADALEAAIEEATNGSKNSKIVRNQLAREAGDLLRSYAEYQRMLAGGDEVKLSSGGFELSRRPEPIGLPGTPQRLVAQGNGLASELELRWRSVHGAHGYQVWMTDKDPAIGANWEPVGYTTRVRYKVEGLESYKAYWFCVSAIGTAGESAQSDPALGRAA